jgi:hypothetical protein
MTAPLNPSIQSIVDECHKIIGSTDHAACPQIEKYTFAGEPTAAELEAAFRDELEYMVDAATPDTVVEAITSRLDRKTVV